MYPPALASALREYGIETLAVAEQGLAGRPDADVLAGAVADGIPYLASVVATFPDEAVVDRIIYLDG